MPVVASPYGHIDLRVADMETALPFYEVFLPALGFTERYHGAQWKVFGTTDDLPGSSYFGLVEAPGHVANENRVAFWAADRDAVDRLAALVVSAGALEVSGPKEIPYGPDYYAVFFADPSGNRFEVYHRLG